MMSLSICPTLRQNRAKGWATQRKKLVLLHGTSESDVILLQANKP